MSYNVSVTKQQGKINLTPSGVSTANCFNTGVFKDIAINSDISSIEIQLRRPENYTSLSEIKIFTGRDTGDFIEGNILQDSARTWLVPEPGLSDGFEFDFLKISGSAHVGLLSVPSSNGSMVVGELSGDHTGSLHVGAHQTVNMSAQEMTVLPFNVQTYKVRVI